MKTIALAFLTTLSACASTMREPPVLGYFAQSHAGFVVRDLDRKWSAERVEERRNRAMLEAAAMNASAIGMAARRMPQAPACYGTWGGCK